MSFYQLKKQQQNLMLKQRWFWVDTKTNFVLLSQQTKHVEPMSKFCRHANIDEFLPIVDMLFDFISIDE